MQSRNLSYMLAAAAALSFCVTAAPASDSVRTSLKACAAMKDRAARLSCYDKLATPQQSKPATPPAQGKTTKPVKPATNPTPAQKPKNAAPVQSRETVPTVPAAQKTPAQFGSELLPMPKRTDSKGQKTEEPTPLDHITTSVNKVRYSLHKKFIITLSNGQIWRQLSSDTDFAHFSPDARITITRGIIGGYNLTIGDSNKLYKVHRVR